MQVLTRLCYILLLNVAAPAVSIGQLQSASFSSASPSLLWTTVTGAVRGTAEANQRTSYQRHTFSAVFPDLLASLLGSEQKVTAAQLLDTSRLQASSPELLVVFSGPKLTASQLSQGDGTLQPLQSLLQDSSAALTLPYTLHTDADALAGIESALQAQQLAQPVHRLGACGVQGAPLSLPAPAAGEAAQVVLVCGPQQDVAASMRLLGEVARLVQASQRSHAFLFVGRPQEPEALQNGGSVLMDTHSRSLLAYPAGSVCNAKCRAQVKILEGIILAVTLLSALTIGLCCMHLLGVPSRFETPKEASRQE